MVMRKAVSMADKKRKAPAYQEYASDILANRTYRLMTLQEKGLFDLLRRECWVNASVPSDPPKLARYLGLPADEVDGALSQSVLSFFEINDGELRSPDLDQYRQILNESNKKQYDGGSNGGKITQLKRKGILEANLQATPKASLKLLSRDEMSRDEMSKDELVLKEVNSLSNNSLDTELQEWLDDYEQSPLCQLN